MATRHILRIVTDPHDPDGWPWLAGYQPVSHTVLTTDNPAEALWWHSAEGAINYYRQVDPQQPVRPDGQPNRPLTVLSVQFDTIEVTP